PGWLQRELIKRKRPLIGAAAVCLAAVVLLLAFLLTRPGPVGWVNLEPVQYTSEGGATLTKLPDRSLLASGKIAPTDAYTITAYTDLEGITAIRVELLTHPSLPAQGPGRHTSANLVLSELRLLAAPRRDPSKTEPVIFQNPTADHNQEGWPVTAAVDRQMET